MLLSLRAGWKTLYVPATPQRKSTSRTAGVVLQTHRLRLTDLLKVHLNYSENTLAFLFKSQMLILTKSHLKTQFSHRLETLLVFLKMPKQIKKETI